MILQSIKITDTGIKVIIIRLTINDKIRKSKSDTMVTEAPLPFMTVNFIKFNRLPIICHRGRQNNCYSVV